MNLYVYKLVANEGGAPCVIDETLSLAICKPIIRRKARKGDWIFGFAGNRLAPYGYRNNSLIYVAEVSEVVPGETYYHHPAYETRPDCIYRWRNGRYDSRDDARYHPGGTRLEHDLGSYPKYERAFVLLSKKYRYFRNEGPTPQNHPLTSMLLQNLTQGHRVSHSKLLAEELEDLRRLAFRRKGLHATAISRESHHCGCENGVGGPCDEDCYQVTCL